MAAKRDWRFWSWVVGSTAATTLVCGVFTTIVLGLTTSRWTLLDGPVWGTVGWRMALVAYAVVLACKGLVERQGVRCFLVHCVVAASVYIGLGSLLSMSDLNSIDAAAHLGNDSVSTGVPVVVVFGDGVLALLAAVGVGLLAGLRTSTVGSPAQWASGRYDLADEDVAAEDFGIY